MEARVALIDLGWFGRWAASALGRVSIASGAGVIALVLAAMPGTAHAQQSEGSPAFRAYKRVGQSCASESRRLCPAADPAAPQPKAMVTCLRPYRTSLSLACRGAINAVTR